MWSTSCFLSNRKELRRQVFFVMLLLLCAVLSVEVTHLLDLLLHWIVKTVKNYTDNVFFFKVNQLFEFQSWPKVFEIQNLNCISGNWAQSIFQSLDIGAVVEGRVFALVGKTHPLLTSRLLIHSWARLATVHIAPMQCTFQRTFIWYFDSDILPKELVFFWLQTAWWWFWC